MKLINHPPLVAVPFAMSGTRSTIPVNPSGTAGAASYTNGFPPVTMQPLASGGTPPWGQDFNGLLYAITNSTRWAMSGGTFTFDNTFAVDPNIGGYPKGGILQSTNGRSFWVSLIDDNTTDPDSASTPVTNWSALLPNLGSLSVTLSTGSVTPTPSQLAVRQIVATGVLSANQTITLPLVSGMTFVVANQTTGAFTVTAIGATGTGVSIPQGQAMTIACDGTNWYATSSSNTGSYLPINGTAVAATKLATARQFSVTGDATTTTPASFDGTANAVLNITISNGAVNLAKMANLTANSLLGNPTGSAATPQAITLTNGLIFSGSALSMGNITPASVNASGTVKGTSLASGSAATSGYPLDVDTGVGRVLIRNNGGGSPGIDAVNSGNTAYVNMLSNSTWQMPSLFTTSTSTSALYVANGGNLRIGSSNGNSKYLRTNPGSAALEFVNNAYSSVVAWLGDDGTLNTVGNANFGLSDARAKDNIDRAAEPRPLHHDVAWTTYVWKRDGSPGRGAIAQDVQAVAPDLVKLESPNGEETLMLDKLGLASEVAFWAARTVDRLARRVAELEEMIYGGGKQ